MIARMGVSSLLGPAGFRRAGSFPSALPPLRELAPPRFAEREVMEYQADSSGSLQFDPRKLDHLGPFLGIRGYEFSELVGRHRH